MYDEKMCFKSTFILELINKSTKTLSLKQEKYTRLSTPSCRRSKEEIICYTFFIKISSSNELIILL